MPKRIGDTIEAVLRRDYPAETATVALEAMRQKRFQHLQRTRSLRAKRLLETMPQDRRRLKRALRLKRQVDQAYRMESIAQMMRGMAGLGRALDQAASASKNLMAAVQRTVRGVENAVSAVVIDPPYHMRLGDDLRFVDPRHVGRHGVVFLTESPPCKLLSDKTQRRIRGGRAKFISADEIDAYETVRISEPAPVTLEEVLAELREDLDRCPATPAGYREAGLIRGRIEATKRAIAEQAKVVEKAVNDAITRALRDGEI